MLFRSFIANTAQVTISGIPLSANGGTGTAGHVLTSNGATGAPYWSAAGVNAAAQYTWSNTHTFQNVITFSANVVSNTTLSSNGVVYNSLVYTHANSYSVGGITAETMDSFSATTYRSAEYLIQLSNSADSTSYHTTKIVVAHDGVTPYATEYGSIITNSSLGTFAVDINAGNVRVRLTASAATVTAKFIRHLIVA